MEKGYKQVIEETREVVLAAISKLQRAYWLAPDAQAKDRIERLCLTLQQVVTRLKV